MRGAYARYLSENSLLKSFPQDSMYLRASKCDQSFVRQGKSHIEDLSKHQHMKYIPTTQNLQYKICTLRQDTTFDCNFGGVFHDFFFHTKNAQKENRF